MNPQENQPSNAGAESADDVCQLNFSSEEAIIVLAYTMAFVDEADTPEFKLINDYEAQQCEVWMRYSHDETNDTYKTLSFRLPRIHEEAQEDWAKMRVDGVGKGDPITDFAGSLFKNFVKDITGKAVL